MSYVDPPKTLEEHVTFYTRWDCRKHGLSDDEDAFVKRAVNQMDNYEFLQTLSRALEEMKEDQP